MEDKRLNDGRKIPFLGLGTFRLSPAQAEEAVYLALTHGYDHIDTANVYLNEEAVGRGLKRSGRPREEIFLTSKIFPTDFKSFEKALDDTLLRLDTPYLDLLLLHRPYGNYLEAYKKAIKAKEAGKILSLGVSNFSLKQVEKLISETGVVPSINQVEANPYHNRQSVLPQFEEKGIVLEAWYPFASGSASLLNEPILTEIAKAHGKSVPQVILRFLFESGIVAIPGSKSLPHIQENIDIFDFALEEEEKKRILTLNKGDPGLDFGRLFYRFMPRNYFEKKD